MNAELLAILQNRRVLAAIQAKKTPTAAIANGMSFIVTWLFAMAASARSRFQPQRAQKGLVVAFRKRRSGTGEPQRRQTKLFIGLF